jgi:hypothetical protein
MGLVEGHWSGKRNVQGSPVYPSRVRGNLPVQALASIFATSRPGLDSVRLDLCQVEIWAEKLCKAIEIVCEYTQTQSFNKHYPDIRKTSRHLYRNPRVRL